MNEEYEIINLDEWTAHGEGTNAENYFHNTDESRMLKVNNAVADDPYFIEEYNTAKKFASLPINTPKVYGLYRTSDGRLCAEYERVVGKKSISRLCADNPDEIPKYAKIFADEAKKFHAVKCDKTNFINHYEGMKQDLANTVLLSKSQKRRLLAFNEQLEETDTCLHGDMNIGNLILDANERPYWIDLGAVDYGNPVYDLGILYGMTKGISFIPLFEKLTHLTKTQRAEFWDAFAKAYTESEDPKVLKKFNDEASLSCAMSLIFRMRYHTKKRDGFLERYAMRGMIQMFLLPKA